ncbi:hypothetical protein B0T17DRAFT_205506 [Bombardia bombarda]|uniref:Zn(2)-C6 fungal-type domain-containing protein n=1 Tax=Bombardia bombarda TaxID=252184 RepID=A0AA39XB28_9PEZI|nr:hypothetical protein B0T17DRAFT_205506 [Bombardia bombarda]
MPSGSTTAFRISHQSINCLAHMGLVLDPAHLRPDAAPAGEQHEEEEKQQQQRYRQLGNGDGEFAHGESQPPTESTPTQASASASASASAPSAGDAGADAGNDAPVNPRKRKKASRACDFCHVNHQPCDNGKPKCGVCQKHNKPCLYLRPTKRRGPQKGYRTALNTYKESAAAWGAVLGAIPGLDALIEGHLRGSTGKSMIASIKDTAQQDVLINRWQESSVFKAFFGHNGAGSGVGSGAQGDTLSQSQDADDDDFSGDEKSLPPAARPPLPPPPNRLLQSAIQRNQSYSSSFAMPEPITPPNPPRLPSVMTTHLSPTLWLEMPHKASRASMTLASLGFAPDETIADFYSMGSNPEPLMRSSEQEFDPALGSESEQRAYYELLMGRSFPG